jgi:BlaI family transcriptional regulator, penicillinase repressor
MTRSSASPLPPPTDAELEILRALWQCGASTVREIHDQLGATKTVGYTTILKQMQVMHRKGLLRRSERFRSHVYEAARTRPATERQIVTTLLANVFDGSARGLLQSVLAGRKVDADELDEIRQLLDEHERRTR